MCVRLNNILHTIEAVIVMVPTVLSPSDYLINTVSYVLNIGQIQTTHGNTTGIKHVNVMLKQENKLHSKRVEKM